MSASTVSYKAIFFRNVADVKCVIDQLLSFHRYFPYDPSPEALKRKTDAALALLGKLNNVTVDERKLKAREGKALWQVSMEPMTLVILSCCLWNTAYNDLYGEVPARKSTLISFLVYKREGISQVFRFWRFIHNTSQYVKGLPYFNQMCTTSTSIKRPRPASYRPQVFFVFFTSIKRPKSEAF